MIIVRVKLIEVFVEGARGGCRLPIPKWCSARSLTRLFTTSELQTSSSTPSIANLYLVRVSHPQISCEPISFLMDMLEFVSITVIASLYCLAIV